MTPQPLGPWDMGHASSIILDACEALLRAAELGFRLLSVASAGVGEQDPEDGKLKGLHLLTCPEKECFWSGAGGLGPLRKLSTFAF